MNRADNNGPCVMQKGCRAHRNQLAISLFTNCRIGRRHYRSTPATFGSDEQDQDVDAEGGDDAQDSGEDDEDGEGDSVDLAIDHVLAASAVLSSPVSMDLILLGAVCFGKKFSVFYITENSTLVGLISRVKSTEGEFCKL